MKKTVCLTLTMLLALGGGVKIAYAEELPDETEYAVMATADEIGTENLVFNVSNGNVTITGLANPNISTDIHLVIPSTINGYPVTSIASNAFKGNINIKSVTFNEGLRYIGYGAFMDCLNLGGSIELPASLTMLDHYYSNAQGAFQNTAITSVKVNGGRTNEALQITNHTFYNCSSLKSVTLSGRESLIGDNAFFGCANLETLVMPAGVVSKTIGANAFRSTAVVEVNIPSTVTSIGMAAFYDCRALTTLTLNEGLVTIGYSAFQDCVNLAGKITIPSTVKQLQDYYGNANGVFQNTSITEVEFTEGGENLEIGRYTFSDCRSLEKVTLPKHLSSVGDNAFAGDVSLENLVFLEGGKTVTIGNNAFRSIAVTTLELPKTILSIGNEAFYGCASLTSLTLNEGLSTIGYGAFQNCEKLTGKLVIPSTVQTIYDYYHNNTGAFQNTAITEVEVVDGNAGLNIGNRTFYGCKSLEKVTLPGRVSRIGNHAFYGDVKLSSMTLESGNYTQTIGESAFEGTGVTEIHIPSKVASIGNRAFYGCKTLRTLTMEEGIETIGYSAFRDCTKLTGEIVIPSTVQNINGYYSNAEGAFQSTAISSVVVKNGNYSLALGSHTFADCLELGKVELSNRISEIGENTFARDASLVWVKMETEKYNLTIGRGAFRGTTNLQVITLPKRLTSIAQECFDESKKLTDVYYAGSEADYASVSVSDRNNTYYFRATVHYNSAGPEQMPDVTGYTGWRVEDGKYYWYENSVLQGYDPENPSYRGKEIYDPAADAWFWLDSIQGGAMAVGKDVYQESDAGPYADRPDGTGKWVRYDVNGCMVKGFDTNKDGTYYFDFTYGAMVKGLQVIDDKLYYFDPVTGIMQKGMINIDGVEYAFDRNGVALHLQWYESNGKQYWYENGVRQGYDPNNGAYRGKEIYDPDSGAWYWLDNVQQGAKAVSKEVYQESDGGKWVRYNSQGGMIKGWYVQGSSRYYYDLVSGAMYKGNRTIDGRDYYFNETTGILESR